MTYNPPYHTEELDTQLRSFFASQASITIAAQDHALRNIAIVGGLMNLSGKLYGHDLSRLNFTLGRLSEAGFPLHAEACFHIFDMSKRSDCIEIGSDFRAACDPDFKPGETEPKAYNLALFSYICSNPYNPSVNGACSTSPNQADTFAEKYTKRWAQAAYNRGVRIVTTFGDVWKEVHTGHLDNPDQFTTLIKTNDYFDHSNTWSPIGAYGYLWRTDSIQDAAQHALPDTPIGDSILARAHALG